MLRLQKMEGKKRKLPASHGSTYSKAEEKRRIRSGGAGERERGGAPNQTSSRAASDPLRDRPLLSRITR